MHCNPIATHLIPVQAVEAYLAAVDVFRPHEPLLHQTLFNIILGLDNAQVLVAAMGADAVYILVVERFFGQGQQPPIILCTLFFH